MSTATKKVGFGDNGNTVGGDKKGPKLTYDDIRKYYSQFEKDVTKSLC